MFHLVCFYWFICRLFFFFISVIHLFPSVMKIWFTLMLIMWFVKYPKTNVASGAFSLFILIIMLNFCVLPGVSCFLKLVSDLFAGFLGPGGWLVFDIYKHNSSARHWISDCDVLLLGERAGTVWCFYAYHSFHIKKKTTTTTKSKSKTKTKQK